MDTKEAEQHQLPTATAAVDSDTIGAIGSITGAYNLVNDEYQIDYTSVQSLLNGTVSLAGSSAVGTVIGGGIAGQGAVGSNSIWTTTTTGTGGLNWNISSAPTTITAGGRMSLQGKDADIDINGRSMSAWMAKVEERLNILTPNPELEKEWDELRRLGERYRKLEKKCKEKSEMWKQLKKMAAPRPDQF